MCVCEKNDAFDYVLVKPLLGEENVPVYGEWRAFRRQLSKVWLGRVA